MSLKKLISEVMGPLVLAGSLAFPSLSSVKADNRTDWENLRDWYIINEGIRTVNDSLRTYNEYQFQRWLIERDRRYFQQYDKNQDKKIDDPDKIPQTFVANYWKDFDGDMNIRGISSEIVGLNKKTFTNNENLIYGVYLPLENIKGKNYNFKLFDKKGNLVNSFNGEFTRDKEFKFCSWNSKNLSEIIKKHGEGTYSVAFYFDGNYWNKREFELLRTDYDKGFFEKYGQRNFQEKPTPAPVPKKPTLSPTPKPAELVPIPEKLNLKPTTKPTPITRLPAVEKKHQDDLVFCVYNYWNDEDKDGLIDHNSRELLGWGLDQYNLRDKVTIAVSGFDNVKGKRGNYGIKSLDGKIIHDETFVFNEDNSSFLHTFVPGELKSGKYIAYFSIDTNNKKFEITKKIEILGAKNKENTTDLPVTKNQISILPTEEPESYKNTNIISKQTKPQKR